MTFEPHWTHMIFVAVNTNHTLPPHLGVEGPKFSSIHAHTTFDLWTADT